MTDPPRPRPSLEIGRLDAAPAAEFMAAMAPLFEGAPRFLERLAAERPFDGWETLFEIGRSIAHSMPEAEQVELIDAHSRLGADPSTVSAHSFREQGYDWEVGAATTVELDVAAELERLNKAYEARFGFRYCVFVAGRPRAELLPGMRAALGADREAELHRAIDAVVDIAVARLGALRAAAG